MRTKLLVCLMLVAVVVIVGGVCVVKDEATAVRIAAKALGPHAVEYPIVSAKREDSSWGVSFSMGDDYLGGAVIIYVN